VIGSDFGGTVFLLHPTSVNAYGIDPATYENEVSALLCTLGKISPPFTLSYRERIPFMIISSMLLVVTRLLNMSVNQNESFLKWPGSPRLVGRYY
jgi:hypothetical protein